MAREHLLSAQLRGRHLAEVRVSSLGPDVIVDTWFEDARGERLHLCFLGAVELKVERFEPNAPGYRLLDVRAKGERGRAVELVPPRKHGVSLSARAVMAVD